MIFAIPEKDESLSQGDILDDCPLFGLIVESARIDLQATPNRWQERVIVLTQACDLALAKTSKILVAVLQPAQVMVEKGIIKEKVVRDQLRRGLVYGWYYLPAAPLPIPLPESVVDLRELHTVPRAALERLMADGKRICRLQPPYREHLAQHFAVTYMRIGLPAPYETEE